MRIILLGTGPFAVPALCALHSSSHEVVCAVSRPPRGRRAKPAPVTLAAEELGLEVWLPNTLNCEESCERLRSLAADLLVVCDYGEILKPAVLEVARLGGINLHGSLLPKYRGAAPVQWAVFHGDAQTGNTVIRMTPGLDAGPCLGVQRVAIDPDETAGELETRLSELGAVLVLSVVDQLAAGTESAVVQDKTQATKAPRLRKEDGLIDWSQPAQQIKNQVRALQPWPRAYTHWQRSGGAPMRVIIHRVAIGCEASQSESVQPGDVVAADAGLLVATGDRPLRIVEIQPAGKRAMSAEEFLRGHDMEVGDWLGGG